MADRTLTVTHAGGSSETYTINRDKFAGVRNMKSGTLQNARTISTPSASDYTVTKTDERNFRIVANSNSATKYINIHPASFLGNYLITFDLVLNSGSFTNSGFKLSYLDEEESSNFGSGSSPIADVTLTQGSNAHSISVENDGVGQTPKMYLRIGNGNTFDVSINNLEIRKDGEVITVDRTAPVIDSDRAGESRPLLSKVVGGAAAAYSLRDLNDKAGNNKVVRVRRESDNNERDFLAKEVSNGTLQNWVNSQTVLPLDLQTLTADGRTGSVIGAQAAYSLRSLGTNQAVISNDPNSPLNVDNDVPDSGKFVVQIRRSSDNAIKSFKADEVSNGTLEAFVNQDVIIEQSDFTSGVDGYAEDTHGTVTREASFEGKSDVLKYNKTDGRFGFKNTGVPLERTSSYTITFEYYADSLHNNKVWGVGSAFANSVSASSNTPTVVSGAWNSATINVPSGRTTGVTGLVLRIQENAGSVYGATGDSTVRFKNIVVTETTGSGFVRTWYDQSGSNFHAIQETTTLQPKIVESGALTKNELGNPSIKLEGTNDHLLYTIPDSTKYLSQNQELSLISFTDKDASGYTSSIYSSISGGSRYFALQEAGASSGFLPRNTISGKNASASASGNVRLTTGITTGNTNYKVASMGGAFVSNTDSYGNDLTASQRLDQILIGKFRTSATYSFNGFITEFLVYNSDQTDNRTALEANIAEHYGISGVPTATDNVNGFVEAWYDQSGNGNDATQTTAGSQPKIVDAGSLSSDGIDFDGTDNFLELNSVLGAGANQSIFVVQKSDDLESSSTATIFDNRDSSGQGSSVLIGSGDFKYFVQSASTTAGSSNLNENLLTSINNSSNTSAGLNGTLTAGTAGGTIANPNDEPRIGARSYSSAALFYNGSIKELITYTSDQSANRPAIEANIANQYGITLS